MKKTKSIPPCPCGKGNALTNCCQPIIDGIAPANTAEQLMRSRYSAFVLKNETYLLKSWHSSTRPETIEIDDAIKWINLKIISVEDDLVEFIATNRIQGKAHKLHEKSRFIFEGGEWFYVDGDFVE